VPERKIVRIIRDQLANLERASKTVEKTVRKKTGNALDTVSDLTAPIRRVARDAERKVGEGLANVVDAFDGATQALEKGVINAAKTFYKLLTEVQIPEGDDSENSTPWVNQIKDQIDSSKIDPILTQLKFKPYSAEDAVRYFDEEADFFKMNTDYYNLEDLKHFGVPNSLNRREQFEESVKYKAYVRKNVLDTVSKKLPKDAEQRQKLISFWAFSFANADLLMGETDFPFPRKFYREVVTQAVENENPIPLVFLKELAGIKLQAIFGHERHADAFAQLQKEADSKLPPHLKEYWQS
jgi:soluble cytochrome b562